MFWCLFWGVRLETHCANRAVLVPVSVLGGAARNVLCNPRCSGACFGECGSKFTVQTVMLRCLFWGVLLETYCANRALLVPVLGVPVRLQMHCANARAVPRPLSGLELDKPRGAWARGLHPIASTLASKQARTRCRRPQSHGHACTMSTMSYAAWPRLGGVQPHFD